jgi:tetratricopeptide (TPR) repeat protein
VSDLKEAARYFKLAADQNDAHGQFYYGFCLSRGQGVKIHKREAAKYYKLAADQNHPKACFEYGVCLEHGDGLETDLPRAISFFRRAADHGDLDGQSRYGFALQHTLSSQSSGNSVVQSTDNAVTIAAGSSRFTEARQYYEKSADGSNPTGMLLYGHALQYGIGIDSDLDGAAEYYEVKEVEQMRWCSNNSLRCLHACHKTSGLDRLSAATRRDSDGTRTVFERCVKDRPVYTRALTDLMNEPESLVGDAAIGSGGSSVVRMKRDRKTGARIAVKIINSPGFDESDFFREV